MSQTWTLHNTERLRALAAEGQSASRIGELLGFTRNAVIGKAARIGAKLHSRQAPPRAVPPKPNRASAWTQAHIELLHKMVAEGKSGPEMALRLPFSAQSIVAKASRIGIKVGSFGHASTCGDIAKRIEAKRKMAERAETARRAAPSGGVGFMALNSTACKRPLWADAATPSLEEQRYCGAEKALDRSYCPACEALCYVPTIYKVRAA